MTLFRRGRLLPTLALLALSFSFTPSALADNLADEADLQFKLGADAYQKGDFSGALEHFLASNRLVPNRNVIFDIARSYEELHNAPSAYRYYVEALDGETRADHADIGIIVQRQPQPILHRSSGRRVAGAIGRACGLGDHRMSLRDDTNGPILTFASRFSEVLCEC